MLSLDTPDYGPVVDTLGPIPQITRKTTTLVLQRTSLSERAFRPTHCRDLPTFFLHALRSNFYADRQGNIKKFPFLSISIGIVNNVSRPLTSFAQVSNIGTELKKAAKAPEKSHYVMDRRHD